jgi:hypothetical protein
MLRIFLMSPRHYRPRIPDGRYMCDPRLRAEGTVRDRLACPIRKSRTLQICLLLGFLKNPNGTDYSTHDARGRFYIGVRNMHGVDRYGDMLELLQADGWS